MNEPCLFTQISSVSAQNTIPHERKENDIFDVMVKFTTNKYEEIISVRGYSHEHLFAEMGGYIGLLTGGSIFQIILICLDFLKLGEKCGDNQ